MVEIKAIVRLDRLDDVLHAIREVPGASGVTVSKVEGFGRQHPPRPQSDGFGQVHMAKVETVVPRTIAPSVVAAINRAAATGRPGDGKIFVLPVDEVINVRIADNSDAPRSVKE